MSGPRFAVNQVWAQRSGRHVRIVKVGPNRLGVSRVTYEYVGVTPRIEGRSHADNARRNWTFIGTFVGCK